MQVVQFIEIEFNQVSLLSKFDVYICNNDIKFESQADKLDKYLWYLD